MADYAPSLAPYLGGEPADTDGLAPLMGHLAQTWPARLAADAGKMAWSGFTGPGRAWSGELGEPGSREFTENAVKPAADLAMTAAGVGMPAAEKGAAGIFGGRLSKGADLNRLKMAEQLDALGKTREQIYPLTGWFKGKDGQWKYEIDDSAARWKPGSEFLASGVLSQYLDHPELFKAYPDLANVQFMSGDLGGSLGRASMMTESPFTGRIAMDTKAAIEGGYDPLKILMHEIQHPIQRAEGFAKGGSVAGVASRLDSTVKTLRASGDPAKAKMAEGIESALHDPDPARKRNFLHTLYERLAGEVEARNVEGRLGLTAAERRYKHFPWNTAAEDVPENLQIFLK